MHVAASSRYARPPARRPAGSRNRAGYAGGGGQRPRATPCRCSSPRAHWRPHHLVITPTRSTTQYQFSPATTPPPEAVLDGIRALELPAAIRVNARRSTHPVLG